MRSAIFLILCLISFKSWSGEVTYDLYSPKSGQYIKVFYTQVGKYLLSKNCLKNGKMKCAAWSATQNPKKLVLKRNIAKLGHPAARYCQEYGAVNRILKDSQKLDDDFCFFNDGSSVSAWSLYDGHHRKR